MSSASLLGGARGSLGRAGHGSFQSFLGQSCCTVLVDRENERTSWSHVGAVEASETLSCSFPGHQGLSKGARCGLPYEFASMGSRSARQPCVPNNGLCSSPAPSRASIGLSAGEIYSTTSLSSPVVEYLPLSVCGGWRATTARVLMSPSSTGRFAPSLEVHRRLGSVPRRISSRRNDDNSIAGQRRCTRAMAASPEEGKKVLSRPEFREAAEMQMMKDWSSNQFLRNSASEADATWEQVNMIIRVVYAIGMYGGLVLAGHALCTLTGVDCWGGFKPSIQTFVQATGWAIPPMMALLLILEDEVVKVCPPARAIRDVEDEELMDFFMGMNPWQFIFVVAAGSLSEELFFRVAIQGGLAHALQYTAKGADETIVGVSALTTIIPFFAPFAQAFAAVLTASLTGSMYYIISCPKDPTYVIAPVSVNKFGWNNRRDIKKRIEAWYERRQLKKIYSPLMEALLALYLGFEWVQTGNIFGPMITHALYSLVVAGNGLRRIHDNRIRLRQRVSEVTQLKEVSLDVEFHDNLN